MKIEAQHSKYETLDGILERLQKCDHIKVSNLQGLFALVSTSVSWWRGMRKIKGAHVTVHNEDATDAELISNPYWKLVPKEWKERFQAVERQKDEIFKSCSVPCLKLRGVHIVMADRLEFCCNKLESLSAVLSDLANEFCSTDNYNKLTDYIQKSLGPKSYKEASKHIPSREVMRDAIGMDMPPTVIPTGMPDWALESNNSSFHVDAMKKTQRRLIVSSLNSVVRVPRERLADIMSAVVKQLIETSRNGKPVLGVDNRPIARQRRRLKRPSIDAVVRETEQFFENFDETADAGLLDQMHSLSTELNELRNQMDQNDASGERMTINNDDALAVDIAQGLYRVSEQLLNEQSMVAGLNKMFRDVGVSI